MTIINNDNIIGISLNAYDFGTLLIIGGYIVISTHIL